MTDQEYIKLYERFLEGTTTAEEERLLETYQDSFDLSDSDWSESSATAEEVKQIIYNRLQNSIHNPEKSSFFSIRRWSVAAALILLFLSVGLFLRSQNVEEKPVIAKTKQLRFKNDVKPGDNKAVLTLEDGSQIVLDDAKNGLLTHRGNIRVTKNREGQLIYHIAGNTIHPAKIEYNTLTTPLGGQYQIVLPDGSKAWLNAGSSLRFPTVFAGKERSVELNGEAYFEIAKNRSMPFKVRARGMEVKVLGTHFNIMAYEDEREINTTLLEGSVEVFKGSGKITLEPGQQASLNKNTGHMNVSEADLEQAVAWKNGFFIFNNENIQSIMRKVSRWYNIDVAYKGNLNNKDFVGTISRDKNVSELLRMLELTGAIHFTIDGRRITVMP
jgi:transmembrane sensor